MNRSSPITERLPPHWCGRKLDFLHLLKDVTEDHTISVTFGLDEDDNGVPDANEPEAAYTLTYHANGGAFYDGKRHP